MNDPQEPLEGEERFEKFEADEKALDSMPEFVNDAVIDVPDSQAISEADPNQYINYYKTIVIAKNDPESAMRYMRHHAYRVYLDFGIDAGRRSRAIQPQRVIKDEDTNKMKVEAIMKYLSSLNRTLAFKIKSLYNNGRLDLNKLFNFLKADLLENIHSLNIEDLVIFSAIVNKILKRGFPNHKFFNQFTTVVEGFLIGFEMEEPPEA